MNKKIIIIIGLLILLSFGAGLILLLSRDKEAPPPAEPLPEVTKLGDDEAVSPIPSFDGTAIWYFTQNGRLFRINADGTGLSEFPLSGTIPGTIKTVVWPSVGNDFIAVSTDDFGDTKNFYDSAQKQYTSLPANIQSFDWLPDGKRIAYIWESEDTLSRQLVIANADGSGYRKVKDVFWSDLQVEVSPLGKEALLVRSKIEGETNKIYRASLETGFIDILVDAGKNLGAIWLPGGEKFIFAQASITQTPRLYLYNFNNRQIIDLNLNTNLDKVLVDKDAKFLYAAVPKKDNTGDEFIKLDLLSYKQETYLNPSQDIRAKNLMEVGGKIYFLNTRDSKIYLINK